MASSISSSVILLILYGSVINIDAADGLVLKLQFVEKFVKLPSSIAPVPGPVP